ncbi:MAG: Nudix family hydrolase [Burkholderiales bacterium]
MNAIATPTVDVAVAVLLRPDGTFLLAQRPRGKVYAGYWEFPGGKVEPGESVAVALEREIREELGVEVERAYPWITRIFTYPHATVRLHFYRVFAWRGDPGAVEHEALSWQRPDSVAVEPLLPANGPVLRGLMLPHEYAITCAGSLGSERFLARLETRLRAGLRLIQVREKSLTREETREFAQRVIALARPYGARVLVNADVALAHMVGSDGVHLTAEQLRATAGRPDLPWCGASCHSAEELRLAEAIGADFVVLGPVRATPSHPDAVLLGWQRFKELAAGATLPVYALGGMQPGDLETAMSCGAHGVAMMRGSWNT